MVERPLSDVGGLWAPSTFIGKLLLRILEDEQTELEGTGMSDQEVPSEVDEKTGSMPRAKCFVIQPFGRRTDKETGIVTDNDAVYEALRPLNVVRKPRFPISVYRADRAKKQKAELHANIVQCIQDSDFCVADFTGRNLNVFYETGFAKGLGREVVLLCQSRSDVPSDLAGFITIRYTMDGLEHLVDDIDQHLDRVEAAVRSLRQQTSESVRYFGTRSGADISGRIRNAVQRIDILQTNLATVHVNYLSELIGTMRTKRALKLRILTLNPQSVFVNYRGQQLGFADDIGLFRSECATHLDGVSHGLRKFAERAQIKLYDDFPTQIAFRFDDEIIACVVSSTGRSRGNCAFLLDVNTHGARRSFVEHFESLWQDRRSVPYTTKK